MTSDRPDKVVKWRNTTAQTLTAAAFAEKVIEHGLRVVGPYEGYVYCALENEDGYDLFKAYQAKKWIYQARRKATDAAAAGNPIIIDISLATGQIGVLRSAFVQQVTAGVHTLYITLLDEDNAHFAKVGVVAAAAANSFLYVPSIGASAAASDNVMNSTGLVIPPGSKLSCYTAGASANANDTLEVGIILELYNLSTEPTWSVARSTDVANITLAASTISTANTMQEFVC